MHGNEGRYKEELFYDEGGEALAQVAQRGCRYPIPGNIQGEVGRGSEQPDLVEDVPAHSRGVGLADLLRCPFQPKLFYDSMNPHRLGTHSRERGAGNPTLCAAVFAHEGWDSVPE